MSSRTTLLGIATGAALMFAAPTSALAVTGTLNKACYSHVVGGSGQQSVTEPIVVTLTGGTPGAGFVMAATAPGKGLGSQGSASGDFDAAGNATAQITDVFPPNGTIGPTKGQPVVITIKDFGIPNPPDVPLGTAFITNYTLNVSTRPSNPRARRSVSVSGTPFAGKRMYGFVVKGTSKHVQRRFLIGTGNICGFASTKAVVAPRPYRLGTYRLYVNAGPTLDKPNALLFGFIIRRTF